ncbi:MAG: hypothetical protein KA732_19020 [Providencia sp.]|uniref:YncE family protein n=1 Tax=Providencia sp. TaxID=589 RepID=UPI001B5FDD44|nr:hypothetical protein [Providencia sp.]MBP6083349.1 hypothetical protein [Providencia sp.]
MTEIPAISYSYLLLLDVINPAITKLNKASFATVNIIDDLGGTPDGIAVDHINHLIYWSNMGDNFEADDGSINVMNFEGSDRKMLIGHGQVRTPKQLLLDRGNARLYWCDREGGKVCSCRTDGSNLQTHVERPRVVADRVDISNQCVGIALDEDKKWLYWTQKGPSKGNKGQLFRVPLAMPPHALASEREDIQLLLDKLPEPIDLLLDQDARILYWTDRGSEPNGNSLNCASIVDDGLIDYRIISRGFKETIGLDYDKTENAMYVADLNGGIYRVTLIDGKWKKIHQGKGYTGIALFSGS